MKNNLLSVLFLVSAISAYGFQHQLINPDSIKGIRYSHIQKFDSEDRLHPFDSTMIFNGGKNANAFWSKYDSCYSIINDKNTKRNRKLFFDCQEEAYMWDAKSPYGNVSRSQVLLELHETTIIFKNHEYSKDEYWIGQYDGSNWNYHYLGINENQFYWIKRDSDLPLYKNDSTLQLEVALVRQLTPEVLPSGAPTFELVQDFIRIEIALCKVIQDSDGDGLTDLLESKLGTNPFSADSDFDNILDNEDLVPINSGTSTPETALIGALLAMKGDSCQIPFDLSEPTCPKSRKSKKIDRKINKGSMFHTVENIIIVSDLPGLKQIQSVKNRLIPMTTTDYNNYRKYNLSGLDTIHISELKPVDSFQDKFTVSVRGGFWGNNFEVTKYDDFWIVMLTDTWII